MATPPTEAPTTLEAQELQMVIVVLQARGWTIADSRLENGVATVIASRNFGIAMLPKPRLKDNA